jgi:hypothetical protein
VYRGFNKALDARVTWLSSDMRDAIAAQRDFLLRPSPEDQTAFREHLFADGRDYVEFVVMIDSELPRGERLGDTDDGWKMALAADDEPLELVQIERVRRPNPLQRTLYPDLNLWSDFYAVRFRRGEREPRHSPSRCGALLPRSPPPAASCAAFQARKSIGSAPSASESKSGSATSAPPTAYTTSPLRARMSAMRV